MSAVMPTLNRRNAASEMSSRRGLPFTSQVRRGFSVAASLRRAHLLGAPRHGNRRRAFRYAVHSAALLLGRACLMSRPPRLDGFAYRGGYRYLLTICAYRRRFVFKDVATIDLVMEQIRFTSEEQGIENIAYCFMWDHLHMLVAGTSESSDLREFAKLNEAAFGVALCTAWPRASVAGGLLRSRVEKRRSDGWSRPVHHPKSRARRDRGVSWRLPPLGIWFVHAQGTAGLRPGRITMVPWGATGWRA